MGTGCVIDSHGKTSRQMDIVLYEREICPVYRVNDTPEATYFPCEGVVAVGEVKASIDGEKLDNCFEKTQSAKELRRYWGESQPTVPKEKTYRNYGTAVDIAGIRSANVMQERERDEIFAFVVAGTSALAPESLVARYRQWAIEHGPESCPNVLATMDGAYVRPFVSDGKGTAIQRRSFHTGDHVGYYEDTVSFRVLVDELYETYRYGHTAPLAAFRRYLATDEDSQPRVLSAHESCEICEEGRVSLRLPSCDQTTVRVARLPPSSRHAQISNLVATYVVASSFSSRTEPGPLRT